MNLQGVLEGLLFVVGDEGLTLDQITTIMEITSEEAKNLLKDLQLEYENTNRGIRISFLGDAFKLTTKKEHKEYYKKLGTNEENNLLSQAALETLAIIAYNQPITRVQIDELRGVNNYWMVRKLVAKGLIKESGKSELPGRPNLYKTTKEFLDYFGISSLEELPNIDFEEKEKEEKDLFHSTYKDEE